MKNGVRRPDDATAGLANTEAKVDIVEAREKVSLVEASHAVKYSAGNGHAGGGDARDFLDQQKPAEVTQRFFGSPEVNVPSELVKAERHSAMPQCSIGQEELRADSSDIRLPRQKYHLVEPVRHDDRNIAIEK